MKLFFGSGGIFFNWFNLDVKSSRAYCDIKTMFPEVNRAKEVVHNKNRNSIDQPFFFRVWVTIVK